MAKGKGFTSYSVYPTDALAEQIATYKDEQGCKSMSAAILELVAKALEKPTEQQFVTYSQLQAELAKINRRLDASVKGNYSV